MSIEWCRVDYGRTNDLDDTPLNLDGRRVHCRTCPLLKASHHQISTLTCTSKSLAYALAPQLNHPHFYIALSHLLPVTPLKNWNRWQYPTDDHWTLKLSVPSSPLHISSDFYSLISCTSSANNLANHQAKNCAPHSHLLLRNSEHEIKIKSSIVIFIGVHWTDAFGIRRYYVWVRLIECEFLLRARWVRIGLLSEWLGWKWG